MDQLRVLYILLVAFLAKVECRLPDRTTRAPINDPDLQAIDMIEQATGQDFRIETAFNSLQSTAQDEVGEIMEDMELRVVKDFIAAESKGKNVGGCRKFARNKGIPYFNEARTAVTSCISTQVSYLKRQVALLISVTHDELSLAKHDPPLSRADYENEYRKRTSKLLTHLHGVVSQTVTTCIKDLQGSFRNKLEVLVTNTKSCIDQIK